MPKALIIAVDATGHPTVAGPVVATAIAFAEDFREPLFDYEDGRGAQRREALLRKPELVPEGLRRPLKDYLQRKSLGVVNTYSPEFQAREEGYAPVRERLVKTSVIRLLERLKHTRPELAGIGLENLYVWAHTSLVPLDLPPAIKVMGAAERSWHINAARFMAREFREDQLANRTLTLALAHSRK